MATTKQQLLVKNKIKAKYSNNSDLIRASGYSEASARQSTTIIQSKGVQELIQASQEIDGLDDKSLLNGISQAIKAQFKNKQADYALRWLQLLYSNKGYQDNRTLTNITINQSDIDNEALELINAGLTKKIYEVVDNQVVKILSTTAKSTPRE